MQLNIITPDSTVYAGEASLVQLPGTDGLFEILTRHAPLIATLGKGKIKIEVNGKNEFFEINGGIVQVLNDQIAVLAE
jgi:F-type H+-transporting ATPase subunit epsilon